MPSIRAGGAESPRFSRGWQELITPLLFSQTNPTFAGNLPAGYGSTRRRIVLLERDASDVANEMAPGAG